MSEGNLHYYFHMIVEIGLGIFYIVLILYGIFGFNLISFGNSESSALKFLANSINSDVKIFCFVQNAIIQLLITLLDGRL